MMRANVRFLVVVVALLLSTTRQAPAPISEQSPTPAPEQSAKPKPKRTITKQQTPSPLQAKATPQRSPFDGTWVGTLNNAPFVGTVQDTFVISGSGTSLIEKLGTLSAKVFQATCDGSTVRWTNSTCANTLTPNPDGKTALVTINCTGVFGVGAYNISTAFRRTSP